MSFVISVDTSRWRAHQASVLGALTDTGAGVVPVAKGNGYGVGNTRLAREVALLGLGTVAVGSAHEAAAVLEAEPDLDVAVLEPVLEADSGARDAWSVLDSHPGASHLISTISSPGAAADLVGRASARSPRRIVLEGLTSMRRFGMTEGELAAAISVLAPALESGAVILEGLALHLPIATPEQPRVGSVALISSAHDAARPVVTGSARVHEVATWGLLWPNLLAHLTGLTSAGSLWLSHLDEGELSAVGDAIPDLPLRLRVGTRLWLGDRAALQARGSVLAVHRIGEGQAAGYHQRRAPKGGHVLVVSGGTSHGVAMTAPRPARSMRQRAASAGEGALEAAGRSRSPFHLPGGGHAWFLEPPHMHVSMLRIPRGTIPPPVGELIDCDVRFTTVQPDLILG